MRSQALNGVSSRPSLRSLRRPVDSARFQTPSAAPSPQPVPASTKSEKNRSLVPTVLPRSSFPLRATPTSAETAPASLVDDLSDGSEGFLVHYDVTFTNSHTSSATVGSSQQTFLAARPPAAPFPPIPISGPVTDEQRERQEAYERAVHAFKLNERRKKGALIVARSLYNHARLYILQETLLLASEVLPELAESDDQIRRALDLIKDTRRTYAPNVNPDSESPAASLDRTSTPGAASTSTSQDEEAGAETAEFVRKQEAKAKRVAEKKLEEARVKISEVSTKLLTALTPDQWEYIADKLARYEARVHSSQESESTAAAAAAAASSVTSKVPLPPGVNEMGGSRFAARQKEKEETQEKEKDKNKAVAAAQLDVMVTANARKWRAIEAVIDIGQKLPSVAMRLQVLSDRNLVSSWARPFLDVQWGRAPVSPPNEDEYEEVDVELGPSVFQGKGAQEVDIKCKITGPVHEVRALMLRAAVADDSLRWCGWDGLGPGPPLTGPPLSLEEELTGSVLNSLFIASFSIHSLDRFNFTIVPSVKEQKEIFNTWEIKNAPTRREAARFNKFTDTWSLRISGDDGLEDLRRLVAPLREYINPSITKYDFEGHPGLWFPALAGTPPDMAIRMSTPHMTAFGQALPHTPDKPHVMLLWTGMAGETRASSAPYAMYVNDAASGRKYGVFPLSQDQLDALVDLVDTVAQYPPLADFLPEIRLPAPLRPLQPPAPWRYALTRCVTDLAPLWGIWAAVGLGFFAAQPANRERVLQALAQIPPAVSRGTESLRQRSVQFVTRNSAGESLEYLAYRSHVAAEAQQRMAGAEPGPANDAEKMAFAAIPVDFRFHVYFGWLPLVPEITPLGDYRMCSETRSLMLQNGAISEVRRAEIAQTVKGAVGPMFHGLDRASSGTGKTSSSSSPPPPLEFWATVSEPEGRILGVRMNPSLPPSVWSTNRLTAHLLGGEAHAKIEAYLEDAAPPNEELIVNQGRARRRTNDAARWVYEHRPETRPYLEAAMELGARADVHVRTRRAAGVPVPSIPRAAPTRGAVTGSTCPGVVLAHVVVCPDAHVDAAGQPVASTVRVEVWRPQARGPGATGGTGGSSGPGGAAQAGTGTGCKPMPAGPKAPAFG